MKNIIKFGIVINIFALIIVNNFYCIFYDQVFSWGECLYNGFGLPKSSVLYFGELAIGFGLISLILLRPFFSTLNKVLLTAFLISLMLFYYPDFVTRLRVHYFGIPYWTFPFLYTSYWLYYFRMKSVEQYSE